MELTWMKGGTSHRIRKLWQRVVTKGGGDDGKWWRWEVVMKGSGDERKWWQGKWWRREVVMKGSGDEGKWWRREVVTKGSGEVGKWWRREVVRKGSGEEGKWTKGGGDDGMWWRWEVMRQGSGDEVRWWRWKGSGDEGKWWVGEEAGARNLVFFRAKWLQATMKGTSCVRRVRLGSFGSYVFCNNGCSCVRSSMRFLTPWLQIALEWLHECCMPCVVGRKPEHETLCFSV